VIGPELGMTLPGMTILCRDSHTSTHGAFGALAFGIGTSQVEHVLATQCLPQMKSGTTEVRFVGNPRRVPRFVDCIFPDFVVPDVAPTCFLRDARILLVDDVVVA